MSQMTKKFLRFTRNRVWLGEQPNSKDEQKSQLTKSREWRLLRAVLATDRMEVSLWDAFVVLREWREDHQGGSYTEAFSSVMSKAQFAISSLDPNDRELADIYIRTERKGQSRSAGRPSRVVSNVTQFMEQLAHHPSFRRMPEPSQWILAVVAFDHWTEDRFSASLVHERNEALRRPPLSAWLDEPLSLLQASVQILERVISKVAYLASTRPHDLNPESAEGAISDWLRSLIEFNVLASGLSERAEDDPDVQSFHSNVQQLVTLQQERQGSGLIRIKPDITAKEDECIAAISESQYASTAINDVQLNLEKRQDLNLNYDQIKACLPDAIQDYVQGLIRLPSRQGRSPFLACLERAAIASYTALLPDVVADEELGISKRHGHLKRLLAEHVKPDMLLRKRHLRQFVARALIHPGVDQSTISYSNTRLTASCLESASARLHANVKSDAEWFRPGGPWSIDFRDGRVYVPEGKLQELHETLLNEPFIILEGPPASGKSVLARALAYHLRQTMPVYFVSRSRVSPIRLAHAIKAVSGLIIIDDLHLHIRDYSLLYDLLLADTRGRCVLWTAHDNWLDTLGKEAKALAQIRRIPVGLSEMGSIIAEKYLASSVSVTWLTDATRPEVSRHISHEAMGNLWMLAYALDGYVRNRGLGSFDDWVKSGVTEDLEDFDNKRAGLTSLIVEMACLSQHEIAMSWGYLSGIYGHIVDCQRLLRTGVKIGVITRTMNETHALYRVHHAVAARVYWKHGQAYRIRKTPSCYADFAVEYAKRFPPNALEALRQDLPNSPKQVRLLQDAKYLGQLLIHLNPPPGDLLWTFCLCSQPFAHPQVRTLKMSLDSAEDLAEITKTLSEAAIIPTSTISLFELNAGILAAKIARESDIGVIAAFLHLMSTTCKHVDITKLLAHLDVSGLSHLLLTATEPDKVLQCLAFLWKMCESQPQPTSATHLTLLYRSMAPDEHPYQTRGRWHFSKGDRDILRESLDASVHTDPTMAQRLWGMLDKSNLLRRYQRIETAFLRRHLIRIVDMAPDLGEEVLRIASFRRLKLWHAYQHSADDSWNARIVRAHDVEPDGPMWGYSRGLDPIALNGNYLRVSRMVRGARLLSQAGRQMGIDPVHAPWRHRSSKAASSSSIRRTPFYRFFAEPSGDTITIYRSTVSLSDVIYLPTFTQLQDIEGQCALRCYIGSRLSSLFWRTLRGKRTVFQRPPGPLIDPATLPFSSFSLGSYRGPDDPDEWVRVKCLRLDELVSRLNDMNTVASACTEWSWIRNVSPRSVIDSIAERVDSLALAATLLQTCNVRDLLDLWHCGALQVRPGSNILESAAPDQLAQALVQASDRDTARELALLVAVRYPSAAKNLLPHLTVPDVRDEIHSILEGDASVRPHLSETARLRRLAIRRPRLFGFLSTHTDDVFWGR